MSIASRVAQEKVEWAEIWYYQQLKLSTLLISQQLILTATENKAQLIDMICEQVKNRALSIPV